MLGRITEGQLLDCPIVTANKLQRRYNHSDLNKIDDKELKMAWHKMRHIETTPRPDK